MNYQLESELNQLISREPWPAQGIKADSHIEDYQWGYLLCYSNGRFEFDNSSHPHNEEIIERWGIYFI